MVVKDPYPEQGTPGCQRNRRAGGPWSCWGTGEQGDLGAAGEQESRGTLELLVAGEQESRGTLESPVPGSSSKVWR